MMIIDSQEITSFTNLNEEICLKVLNIVQKEFGEIGDFLIQNSEISFSVYREYFKNAPKTIISEGLKLKRIGRFDDPVFSLGYKIINHGEKRKNKHSSKVD